MSDVVDVEAGLGVHIHNIGTEEAAMYQEISPGRCWLCAYWPEPPAGWQTTSVDRETGVITVEALKR